jgi:hypothetical protein
MDRWKLILDSSFLGCEMPLCPEGTQQSSPGLRFLLPWVISAWIGMFPEREPQGFSPIRNSHRTRSCTDSEIDDTRLETKDDDGGPPGS